MAKSGQIEQAYKLAKERCAALGVDTEKAMSRLGGISISLHCWQGDDVGGFESPVGLSGGGIMATGAYPGLDFDQTREPSRWITFLVNRIEKRAEN